MKPITFRLPSSLLKKLKEIALKKNVSISAVIRSIITKNIDKKIKE